MNFGRRRVKGSTVATTTAIAFLFVAVPGRPAAAQDRDSSALRTAIIATVVGSVLDGVTTIAGLRGGQTREMNPILGHHPARIIVLKSLFTVPQILAEKHLVEHGHLRAAKWVGYVVGGFATAVAVNNVRTSR